MRRTKNWQRVAVAMAIALSATGAAFAAGGGRGDGHGGPGGPGIGGLLEPLLFPCRAACAEDARSCFETAKDAARTCIAGACTSQVAAAKTACQADRTSADCKSALETLRTCAQSCVDAQGTELATCRSDAQTCVTACGNS